MYVTADELQQPLKTSSKCKLIAVKRLVCLSFRSCAQQAVQPHGRAVQAEWKCLAALLAQIIAAHLPSVTDASHQKQTTAVVTHLLHAATTQEPLNR